MILAHSEPTLHLHVSGLVVYVLPVLAAGAGLAIGAALAKRKLGRQNPRRKQQENRS